ncbi:hypothetical protein AKJ65_02095 [candidate division MSBL1 archaeon SCGC-AAA259E19]|uniref:Solute-binding protein family 5 domain-containing protein n=1 Tax=candidate division MSBL1 archaeon SCGC-AAA259E19 TaxID=1698264 RepID=A0A133UM55_9EURY|nr:hypothetical protein AKJ65_02095 [candidate division MSBL1 archaeon SCGC-AAA259E19]
MKNTQKILITTTIAVLLSFTLLFSVMPAKAQEKNPQKWTIKLGGAEAASRLNPFVHPSDRGYSLNLPYSCLFRWDARDMTMKPWLAKDWNWNEDGSKLTIMLREKAHFSDGSPVTADDVVFSLETAMNNPVTSNLSPRVKDIEGTGEFEVTITMKEGHESDRTIYLPLTGGRSTGVFIVPEERWRPIRERMREDNKKVASYMESDPDEIVGPGMYTPVEISPQRVVLRQVKNWWGLNYYSEKEFFNSPMRVEEIFYPNAPKIQSEFVEGKIDLCGETISTIPKMVRKGKQVGTYRDEPPWTTPPFQILAFHPNHNYYPLSENWCRVAISLALDRKQMNEKGQGGMSYLGTSPTMMSSETMFPKVFNEEAFEKYKWKTPAKPNLEKAREILDKHTFIPEGKSVRYTKDAPEQIPGPNEDIRGKIPDELPDHEGRNVKLEFNIRTFYHHETMSSAEIASRNLHAVGIKAPAEWYEFGTFIPPVVKDPPQVPGMWLSGPPWAAVTGPIGPIQRFRKIGTGDPTNWRRTSDWEGLGQKRVENLLSGLARKPMEEWIQPLKEVQEIMAKELPVIPYIYVYQPYPHWTDDWVDWPDEDDPFVAGCYPQYYVLGPISGSINWMLYAIDKKGVAEPGPSISVEDISLSSTAVKTGESVTVSVGVKNAGDAEGTKTLELLINGGVEKTKDVTLGAGESTTKEFTVSKADAGEYTIKVGERSSTLTVRKRVEIPEGLKESVDLAISVAENAVYAANSAQDTAQKAVDAAQTAAESADEAKAAAQEARDAAREAGGASTTMVVGSMVVTIIVVLGGVYAIIRRQTP